MCICKNRTHLHAIRYICIYVYIHIYISTGRRPFGGDGTRASDAKAHTASTDRSIQQAFQQPRVTELRAEQTGLALSFRGSHRTSRDLLQCECSDMLCKMLRTATHFFDDFDDYNVASTGFQADRCAEGFQSRGCKTGKSLLSLESFNSPPG